MGWFGGKKNTGASLQTELLGLWATDAALTPAQDRVEMEFHPDGRLTYTMFEDGTARSMLLTYRVEPGVIVTDQPSHPSVERTAYVIAQGILTMAMDGLPYRFRRIT